LVLPVVKKVTHEPKRLALDSRSWRRFWRRTGWGKDKLREVVESWDGD
jgi:hypothetical protein